MWSNLCLLIVSLCRLKKVKYLQNEYWALFSTFSVGEYLFIWFRFFLFFFFFLLGTLLNTFKKTQQKKPKQIHKRNTAWLFILEEYSICHYLTENLHHRIECTIYVAALITIWKLVNNKVAEIKSWKRCSKITMVLN